MLYEEVRRSGGITIPHTTATAMGTDWSDNDPEVEPLVEIFQGDRYSYEQPGAPLTDTENRDLRSPMLGGPQAEGFVSNALAKGYKLGFIASSDHALDPPLVRHGVGDRPQPRRGARGDARAAHLRRHRQHRARVLDRRPVHGRRARGPRRRVPEIRVKAVGTRPFLNAEILRNGQSIYQSSPGTKSTSSCASAISSRSPERATTTCA